MSAQLFYSPQNVLFTSRGLPAGAASVYFFYTGTTSKAPIYSDAGLTTPLTNPVPADGLGKLPNIYMDSATIYRVRAVDSNGVPMGLDTDPYIPGTTGDAAASAAAASAVAAKTSETNAAASAADAEDSASASANSATAAALVAIAAGTYPNAAATNVPRGLTQASVGAITAGSGGTNGTFSVAWSGGNFATNPTATFTVAGGVLTAFTITGPGRYIGASPTVPTPSFAASSGLTGAAVALTAQFLISSGVGYWVVSSDGSELLHYQNVNGTATIDSGVSFPLSPSLTSLIADVADLTAFLSTTTTIETYRLGSATTGPDDLTTAAGGGLTVFGPQATSTDSLIEVSRYTSTTIGTGAHKLVVRRLLSGADYQTVAVRDLPPVIALGKSTYTSADFAPITGIQVGDFIGFAMPLNGPHMGYTSGSPAILNGYILEDQSTVGDHGNVTSTGTVGIEAVFGTVTSTLAVGYDALSPDVQAMLNDGATSYSPAHIALPSGSLPVTTARMSALATGQSNSTGTNATPPISTTQLFSNVMTTGGVRTQGPSTGGSTVTTTVALIQNTATGADGASNPTVGETILSGVDYTTQLRLADLGGAAGDIVWHPTDAGWTSQVIENLRKGQYRYGPVTDQLAQVYGAAGVTPLSFAAHAFIQGESNATTTTPGESNTRSAYLAQIVAYFAEVRGDMKAKSGQAWNPHTGMFQIPYATLTGVNPGAIQLAQFDAINNDPLCHFVMPLYIMTTGGDQTHYTNVSQKLMGLYWGRWLYQLVHEQRVPDCVWPLSVTAKGTTVSIKFRTPTPLTLDTVKMFAATDYGFKIVDGTGTLTLSNIQIVDNDTVQITINRALSGTWKARYALDYAGTGQAGIGYACGNLRDTTATTYTYSGTPYQLFHAAPQFEMTGEKLDSTVS